MGQKVGAVCLHYLQLQEMTIIYDEATQCINWHLKLLK